MIRAAGGEREGASVDQRADWISASLAESSQMKPDTDLYKMEMMTFGELQVTFGGRSERHICKKIIMTRFMFAEMCVVVFISDCRYCRDKQTLY